MRSLRQWGSCSTITTMNESRQPLTSKVRGRRSPTSRQSGQATQRTGQGVESGRQPQPQRIGAENLSSAPDRAVERIRRRRSKRSDRHARDDPMFPTARGLILLHECGELLAYDFAFGGAPDLTEFRNPARCPKNLSDSNRSVSRGLDLKAGDGTPSTYVRLRRSSATGAVGKGAICIVRCLATWRSGGHLH